MNLDTCMFCRSSQPVAVYTFPPLQIDLGGFEDLTFIGGEMTACRGCAWWIDRADLENLTDRVIRRHARKGVDLPAEPLASLFLALFASIPTAPQRRELRNGVPTPPATESEIKPIEVPPLHPRRLPKVRDRLVQFWRSSAIDFLLSLKLQHMPEGDLAHELSQYIDIMAGHAEKAQLFWVDRDFTTLATHAASDMPDVPMQRHEPLATEGVLMWQTPIYHIPSDTAGTPMPIIAAQWGPIPGGIFVTFYTRTEIVADFVHEPHRLQEVRQRIGWLIPVNTGIALKFDEPPTPKSNGLAFAITALRATWIVSQSPYAEVCDRPVAKATRKAYSRTNRTAPVIRLVRLRAKKQTHTAGTQGRNSTVRTHQWWVDPFWRMQPVGPGRSRREWRYVIGHRRGPEGAPLRITKKVNVIGDPNTPHTR